MRDQKQTNQMNRGSQGTKFYLEQFDSASSRQLKILIAKFLDKKGVIPWQNEQGAWIAPHELAKLDRQALARQFVSKRLNATSMEDLNQSGFQFEEGMTFEQFLIEIEKHIDLRLPIHYFAHVNQQRCGSRAQAKKYYPGAGQFNGFDFKYRANYILDLRYVERLKQSREVEMLKQLRALARRHQLTLKPHTLTPTEVRELLEGLRLNSLTEVQYQTYFINNNPYYSQAKVSPDELFA